MKRLKTVIANKRRFREKDAWRNKFIKQEALTLLTSGRLWRPVTAAILFGTVLAVGTRAIVNGLIDAAVSLLSPDYQMTDYYKAAFFAADLAAAALTAPLAAGIYRFAVRYKNAVDAGSLSSETLSAADDILVTANVYGELYGQHTPSFNRPDASDGFASMFVFYRCSGSIFRAVCMIYVYVWRIIAVAAVSVAGISSVFAVYRLALPLGEHLACMSAIVVAAVAAAATAAVFILAMDAKMAYYIAVKHPDMTAGQAVGASRIIMHGHKREAARFFAGFLPWFLLSAVTFGISMIFFSAQYMLTADILFSDYIYMAYIGRKTTINIQKENLLIGADIFNGK